MKKDISHTNEERICKVMGLISGIHQFPETPDNYTTEYVRSLKVLAEEASSSIAAIEKFLADSGKLHCCDSTNHNSD